MFALIPRSMGGEQSGPYLLCDEGYETEVEGERKSWLLRQDKLQDISLSRPPTVTLSIEPDLPVIATLFSICKTSLKRIIHGNQIVPLVHYTDKEALVLQVNLIRMYDYPNVSDLHTKLPLSSPICEEGLCKGPARNQRGDTRIPSRNAFATMNRLRTGIEISGRSDEEMTGLLEIGKKGHGSIAQLEYSLTLRRSAMRPMEIGGGSVMSIKSCGESGSSEKFASDGNR
jgi:hypothetical protein